MKQARFVDEKVARILQEADRAPVLAISARTMFTVLKPLSEGISG